MSSFKEFYQKNPNLEMQELIEYFSIFGGFDFPYDSTMGIKEAIYKYILLEYENIRYQYNLDDTSKSMLTRLARGNRKIYSVYKDNEISQIEGRIAYKNLFDNHLIYKEKSREEPPNRRPREKLKRYLRDYKIEDKIRFYNGYSRFWFTFIEPNVKLLRDKEYDKVEKIIESGFEKFVSLEFEYLCEKLLIKLFGPSENIGSFWTRTSEIDLLFLTKKKMIAGEAKWKNHKICKNILTLLQKKCQRESLDIDIYALFSKSGFSNELKRAQGDILKLYTLEEFKILCI